MTAVFGDIELARRIERLDADLMKGAAETAQRRNEAEGFAIRVAGGVATFAEEGSPFNKVAGLGFGGTPTDAELEAIENRYGEVGSAVQVELSNLAEPAIGEALTRRGYALVGFENVLGASVESLQTEAPSGVEVRRSPEGELDAWLEVVLDGFEAPDEQGVPAHEEFPREAVERAERDFSGAGVERYSALVDGELAGGGSLYVAGGIGFLAGAATAPAFRRRGVHGALLSARVAALADRNCDVAVVVTQPGSTAQRNVWRRDFEILYTRAVLVKSGTPPGRD